MKKPINWKKIIWNSCWIVFSIGLIVLFGASIQQKNKKKCSAIKIEIKGAEKHLFIDEKDVMDLLLANGPIQGSFIHSLPLRKMETAVEQISGSKMQKCILTIIRFYKSVLKKDNQLQEYSKLMEDLFIWIQLP